MFNLFRPFKPSYKKLYKKGVYAKMYRSPRSKTLVTSNAKRQQHQQFSNTRRNLSRVATLNDLIWPYPDRPKITKQGLGGSKLVENKNATYPSKSRLFSLPQLNSISIRSRPLVTICEARQARTQVMHALGHAGKRGQKPKTFNKNSTFQCERI